MQWTEDDGAIVAESALIIALITLLCGTILQLGVIIHTRNTMIDAASAGARYAALADRNPHDAPDRARSVLAGSVPNSQGATIQVTSESGGEIIAVTIDHQLPILGFITGPIPLSVTARAYDLTPT